MGWTGSAGLAPPTSRLLPLPRPFHCGPRLCTLSTSDTEPPLRVVSLPRELPQRLWLLAFSSLSPCFSLLAILSAGGSMEVLISLGLLQPHSPPGPLPRSWRASGRPSSGVSSELTFHPTPPFSLTFQLPPALRGPSEALQTPQTQYIPSRTRHFSTNPKSLPLLLPAGSGDWHQIGKT